MTWLDEFTFWTGSAIVARYNLPGIDGDVFKAVERLALETVRRLETSPEASPTRGMQRFEADLLPFYAHAFKHIRHGLRISPSFVRWAQGGLPAAGGTERLAQFFETKDYVYIDCPPGTFALGADVEVKAIFMRSATLVGAGRPENVVHPGHLRFEAIVGAAGLFSLGRIGWCADDHRLEFADDDITGTPPIALLLAKAGVAPSELVRRVYAMAIATMDCAITSKGSVLSRTLPKIPPADRARKRPTPHPSRTLFDMTEIVVPTASVTFDPTVAYRN